MELARLSPELQLELIMHLQPRHVYKLMRTNKAIYELCCKSKAYWERVAFHLAFRSHIFHHKVIHDLYDMALLQMGYRHAMDTFIEAVREDIRTSPTRHFLSDRAPRPTPNADGPLSELIPYVLDMHPEYILIPQADMRLQARDLMLDAEPTNDQVLDMLDGNHWAGYERNVKPVTDGTFITEDRRKHRASAHFLQLLEDESALDLDAKRRILAGAVRLVKDICEKRETWDFDTQTFTRREDPIPNYEWVSIMRPPWNPDDYRYIP